MRRCFLIIALFAISWTVKAQQDPQFSQNMYNHMTVNPGFAGIRGNWTISGIYRNQWQKMEQAPETYAFNVDAPLRIGRAEGGIGLNLMSDKLGMQTNLHLMLDYAYRISFRWGVLSIGTKVGVVNSKIEGEYHTTDVPGNKPPSEDPALGAANADLSKILFDMGIGAFLTDGKYYVGVSMTHLTRSKMQIGQTGEFFWARHMYLTGGYTFPLSPKIDMLPSVFIKTDFVSSQYNVNSNFIYDGKYWVGLSYRYEEAVVFMGGIELKNGLMVGYSYDWNMGSVGRYTAGSHEVTLSYNFGMKLGKREKIYKSVRFL